MDSRRMGPFKPEERIIEYRLRDAAQERLVGMRLREIRERDIAAESLHPAVAPFPLCGCIGCFPVPWSGIFPPTKGHG